MAWKGRREAANSECLFWYSSNSAKPCGLNCNMQQPLPPLLQQTPFVVGHLCRVDLLKICQSKQQRSICFHRIISSSGLLHNEYYYTTHSFPSTPPRALVSQRERERVARQEITEGGITIIELVNRQQKIYQYTMYLHTTT